MVNAIKRDWKWILLFSLIMILLANIPSDVITTTTVEISDPNTQCSISSSHGQSIDYTTTYRYTEFAFHVSLSDQYRFITSLVTHIPFITNFWPWYYGSHNGDGEELGYTWLWHWPTPCPPARLVLCHK